MSIETVVCTISDEGTPRKKELVSETMENLHRLAESKKGRLKVVGVHLGGEGEIAKMMQSYFSGRIEIIPVPEGNFVSRAKQGMVNLFGCAKRKVAYELDEYEPQAVLYMEGDKPGFVGYIDRTVTPILDGTAEVTVATRSEKGFDAFPWSQKLFERRANKEIAKITSREMDLMYGPRAWNPQTANYFASSLREDFGALTYSVVRPMIEGKSVVSVEVPGFPQDGYMEKYPALFRFAPLHFVYRAMQNDPHLEVARLAQEHVKR